MPNNKNLLHYLAEWWQNRQVNASVTSNWNKWLPTPGNIFFTLLIVGLLIFTQRTWANNSPNSVNAPGPSATTINYQGRLADSNGNPINGNRTIQFTIYDAASSGNVVWGAETHANVPVTDGLFNVGLGSLTPGGVPTTVWNGDRYLQITVNGEALSPRELIRSVPIAGMALTVPNGAIGTNHLANSSVTKQKLGSDIVLQRVQAGRDGAGAGNSGWTLHEGTGNRIYTIDVTFATSFVSPPQVLVSLASLDSYPDHTRITVYPTDVTTTGFKLKFETWHDSRVYGATATWVAYGSQ